MTESFSSSKSVDIFLISEECRKNPQVDKSLYQEYRVL